MLKNKVPFLINLATMLTKNALPVAYVAGKVTGLPGDAVKSKFKAAQTALEAQGYKVLNPCEFITIDEDWSIAMQMALTLLNMADVIYMLSDWQQSSGAKMEFNQAITLGMPVIFE